MRPGGCLVLWALLGSAAAASQPSPALWMPFGRIGYILQRLSTFDSKYQARQEARLSPIPAAFRSNNVPEPAQAGYRKAQPRPFAQVISPEKTPPPPTTSQPTTTTTAAPANCQMGAPCSLALRSFETKEPAFEYAYSHSTPIGPLLAQVFDSTMGTKLPGNVSWKRTMAPEAAQLMMNLMRVSRPNRVLVVGVFTGFGLIAASTGINERGIVVGVENPGMAVHWTTIGQKYAQQAKLMGRIQVRSELPVPDALQQMGRTEPGSFDFVLLDDLTLENYLVDYERCLVLLRSGGVLLINDALAGGEVIADRHHRSSKGEILDQLNRKLRTDPRITASFLPISNGVVLAVKN